MNVLTSATGPVAITQAFSLVPLPELRASPRAGWLWYGYLAAGRITLLIGRWKVGKTTLASLLLARMAAGGMLAGRAVAPARALIVSEEGDFTWVSRHARLGFGPNIRFARQPFHGRATPHDWRALIDRLVALHSQEGLDLVMIDSLASFLPGSEADPEIVLDFLRELHRLTALGICVLILHHPRKAKSAAGHAARGNSTLTQAVDVILELDEIGLPGASDRRRLLWAFSRYEETPPRQLIELNADETDYIALGDFAASDVDRGPAAVFQVLEGADRELTIPEILSAWPADAHAPHAATAWRWLEDAVQAGRVIRTGTGRRNHPYRYWVAREAGVAGGDRQ